MKPSSKTAQLNPRKPDVKRTLSKPNITENNLVGDPIHEAFASWINNHQEFIWNFVHKFNNIGYEEDDAFMLFVEKAFSVFNKQQFQNKSSFDTYIHRALTNYGIDLTRRAKRLSKAAEKARNTSNKNITNNLTDVKSEEERKQEIEIQVNIAIKILEKEPPEYDYPLILRLKINGWTQKQIAEKLGITQGAISKRILRIKHIVQNHIKENGLL